MFLMKNRCSILVVRRSRRGECQVLLGMPACHERCRMAVACRGCVARFINDKRYPSVIWIGFPGLSRRSWFLDHYSGMPQRAFYNTIDRSLCGYQGAGMSNIYSTARRGIGQPSERDCRLQVSDWGWRRSVGGGRRPAPQVSRWHACPTTRNRLRHHPLRPLRARKGFSAFPLPCRNGGG
jgi:GT2 family glycosyltransferase